MDDRGIGAHIRGSRNRCQDIADKIQTALKTGTTVLNSIQDSRDSLSGVSLDEEATNMMAYVSAYNAASRLMTALDEVLNTLISNTGA